MADPAMMFDSLMSALIDPGTWFFSAISILLAALAIWLISKLVDIRDKPIVWVISAAALPAFASALLAGFNDQFGNELFARTAIILLIIFLAFAQNKTKYLFL